MPARRSRSSELRLAAPGTRSAQIAKSAPASNWAFSLNPVAVVPPVVPLLLDPIVAVPPIVASDPKRRTGPGSGAARGNDPGRRIDGRGPRRVREGEGVHAGDGDHLVDDGGKRDAAVVAHTPFWALLFASRLTPGLPVPVVVVEDEVDAPRGAPN